MAKVISYKFLSAEISGGTEEKPELRQLFIDKELICRTDAQYEANLAVAQKESWCGEYTVTDDGEDPAPTAQEDTDAMLIDHELRLTLLELGVTE